jgi:hypothetical protein
MSDSVGNVIYAPGASKKAFTTDLELLASGINWSQFGVTLRQGAGVLAVGTPLVKHSDSTYGPPGVDRTVAATVTFTDAGDIVTTPAVHGLNVGDEVQVATVVTTTGIVANTTYYVKTVPTTTTLTLSATNGGSTLALTTDGTGTVLTQWENADKIIGFLRLETDTGVAGTDLPRLGNVVYRGTLKYSLIKAANGATDLTAAVNAALFGRVDLDRDFYIF